ncbi:ATP-binding protein [Nocardiopsis sp. NPDC058631]|uniref:ATP-binding protein n=1 Tax=Nocardiopsis sp. NPDC058631 TaxID=3346566 RepID=UPI0036696EC4
MRFSILGPLLVHDTTGRPVTIGGARLRVLLSLLLLRPGQRVSVEGLIDGIWAGAPPAAAGNALQALVSRLRRALGEGALIDGDGTGYRLAVDPGQVDADRFEALAGEGRTHLASGRAADAERALGEALALWRGPALSDLTAHGVAEDIALALAETHRSATEDHLAARAELGHHAEILPRVEALARREPSRERPVELLMRVLAAAGRTADALTAYDRFRARLADGLGLDPSPQLRDTHLRLLRGEFDAPSPAPAARPQLHLPVTLTSFVPRDTEVGAAVDLLARERLVTLTGPGGAGKTRLSIETAAALAARAPQMLARGCWFVELASRSGADVLDALVGALDLRAHAMIRTRSAPVPIPPLERVVSHIGDHAALIVLDNCEHLVEDVARAVEPLLARCPRLRVLATSREPLGVPGEQLMPVPSLALPPEGAHAEKALTYPAVALFTERAAAARPGFAVTPDNVAHVVRVARELDGMPLALELAAARLRSMTIAQLAERLTDRFRLLTGGSRGALPRHRTLRAVVDWSWELLDEPERRLLRRLSIFTGGAGLEAIERVCADPSDPGTEGRVDGRDVWTALFSLVDKSLVIAENPARDDEPPRYRQLETVRAYAAERLALSGEEVRVRDAHALHIRDLWRGADPLLRGRRQAELLVRLAPESADHGAAVRWAVERRDADLALDLVEYTQWYWTLGGSWRQLGRWSEAVLDMLGDRIPEGRTVAYASCLFHRAGEGAVDHDVALERVREIEEIVTAAGERIERHPVLVHCLLYGAMIQGRPGEAYERLVTALDQPDPWMRAMVRCLLSLLDAVTGHTGESLGKAEAALEEFRACGDAWGVCQALAQVVDVYRFEDLERCCELLAEGIQHAQASGLTGMVALFRVRRVQALTDLGDLEAARLDLTALFDFEGPVQDEHMVLLWLTEAQWLREAGELGRARAVVERMREELNGLGGFSPVYIEGGLEVMSAVLHWRTGAPEEAWRDLGRAWRLASQGLGPVCAEVLDVFAMMLAPESPRRAARVLGWSEALRGVPDNTTPYVVRAREHTRRELGGAEYGRLVAEARSTAKDEILARAGEWLPPAVSDRGSGGRRHGG